MSAEDFGCGAGAGLVAPAPGRIAIIASAEGRCAFAPGGGVTDVRAGGVSASSFEQTAQRPAPIGLNVSHCPQTMPISWWSLANVASLLRRIARVGLGAIPGRLESRF